MSANDLSTEPIAVRIEEAARLIGISRGALYPLVMSGEIPSMRVGARRLVLVSGLRAWAESRSREQMEGQA